MGVTESIKGMEAKSRWRLRDRDFFLAFALLQLALVFWGFGPTFYWTLVTPPPHPTMLTAMGPAIRALFMAHGLVFTAWILLYVVQTALVASHRTALHRRLGLSATVLVPLVVLLGLAVSFAGLKIGFHIPDVADASFFAVSLFPSLYFGLVAWIGIIQRRTPAAHKRWMVLATMMMMGPAVARIGALDGIFPDWMDPACLLLPALMLWDMASLRRFHPVTLWGGLIFLVVDLGVTPFGQSELWLAAMRHLTG